MSIKARAALIVAAVCVAVAGGVVTWRPWGGALPSLCGYTTTGQSGVAPGTVVGFWVLLVDRGDGDEPITLRSATLNLEDGPGRFVGARARADDLEHREAVVRWPDAEHDITDQSTDPLPNYRMPRHQLTSVYFMVEQTEPGLARWGAPSITYQQGWRTYTASSPDCYFETDSRPI